MRRPCPLEVAAWQLLARVLDVALTWAFPSVPPEQGRKR